MLAPEKYFVKVLKTDTDYFKEGQIQHHCVRTYLDKYKSIIISVRKTHEKGMERMTCEFLTNSEITNPHLIKDYSNTPTLVQARMKYNKNPEGNWEVIKRLLRKEFLDYTCKPRNATRPMSFGSTKRIKMRGERRGAGNLGRYSKPTKPKMIGKKASKKTDFRYECSVCKKQHMQASGIRAKKVEFV